MGEFGSQWIALACQLRSLNCGKCYRVFHRKDDTTSCFHIYDHIGYVEIILIVYYVEITRNVHSD